MTMCQNKREREREIGSDVTGKQLNKRIDFFLASAMLVGVQFSSI